MRSFYESGGSGCHFAGLMVALHPLTSTLHLNPFFGVGVCGGGRIKIRMLIGREREGGGVIKKGVLIQGRGEGARIIHVIPN